MRRDGWIAFGAYAAVSFLYWGLRLVLEPGSQWVGAYDDSQVTIWLLGWWPHAILHGHNPFVANIVWPPVGVNLAWVVAVPALALPLAPLTLLAGPIASFNVLTILLPAASATTAFVLCRHVTGRWWPSLVGGYLFGFSSYVVGHVIGQPQLTAIFVVPLVALVILQFVEGARTGRRLAVALGLLLALQLYISTEISFTLMLALAGSLVVAWLVLPRRRRTIQSAVAPIAGAYAIGFALAAPLLYYAFTAVRVSGFQDPGDYAADLVNLVVPSFVEAAGAGPLHDLTRHFPGNPSEQGAFVGIPLLAIVVLFARSRWRTDGGRFLVVAFGIALFAALGPALVVAGHRTVPLPNLLGHETVTVPGVGTKFLPVLDNALPVRIAMYASLAAAVIVARWMTSRPAGDRVAWVLPGLTVLLLVPNPAAAFWSTTYHVPALFTKSAYRSCLARDDVVLPQPIRGGGPSMLWQAAAGYRFRMTGGRLQTSAPSAFLHPASIAAISVGDAPTPDRVKLLRAYIAAKGITVAIVDKAQAAPWTPALDRIAKRQDVGGVFLYRVAGRPRPCPRS